VARRSTRSKKLDQLAILVRARRVRASSGSRASGDVRSSIGALNLKRFGFFVLGDRAKLLTSRMWLNAQFFVVKVVREAPKNMKLASNASIKL